MKDFNDANLRREIIMEHYSNPKNKSTLERVDMKRNSPHCVDELNIQIEYDGDNINDIKWDGVGCAVFQSSSDIFVGMLKGKDKEFAIKLATEYENMINAKEYDASILGDLQVYKNVKQQLNRLYCANMVSQLILKK